MAGWWQRWRGPALGGIAIFVVSVPLLLSHPAAATTPAPRSSGVAALPISDRVVLRQTQRLHQAAIFALLHPTPAPVAQPPMAPVAVPAAPAAAPARPSQPFAPAVHANNLVIPRLGLNQPVGWYTDCLGRAAVPRWGTWRWSCAGSNNIYVMAHNPGIFTPILALHVGDLIEYGDPSGRIHTYRVSFTTIVSNTQLWPLGATGSPAITLQTCWTWDGTRDFIVRALEI